jgi:hypothetical protein
MLAVLFMGARRTFLHRMREPVWVGRSAGQGCRGSAVDELDREAVGQKFVRELLPLRQGHGEFEQETAGSDFADVAISFPKSPK